ncbi:MAG: hypothetical protein A3H98_04485 [Bacteroidetes bacterium RIFCSPLOWO2_02_FULL_36_8]|nr:MAG: hypothetical protein A3H98_04485 [Bacteroidetes bacterium RIFCSPLOWO2_02_FULL_36_8]
MTPQNQTIIRWIILFIATIFLLLGQRSNGQTKSNNNLFAFIENSSDSSSLKFIQTFKCISKKGDDIASLYRAIKQQAHGKGANCFKFKNFTCDSIGTMTLTLDTYYGDDTFIKNNLNNHEKNTVYIISDGNFNNKTYTFRADKVKRIIKSGTYYKHTIKQNEKVKINKGGFFGATATIVWEENKICKFYSLSGFGLADVPFGIYPTPTYYGSPGIGVSFTTGKLKSVDRSFGLLLTMILKQHQ